LSERKYRVWCVSDGRAGIERQTLAVASALGELVPIEAGQHEGLVKRLTPQPPQVWLPPQLWPAPLAALPPSQRALLQAPWPDVWIANGRRSIAYSLRAKAWSGGKSFVVQLQNPRIAAHRFDLVVPPVHDGVTGENVIPTLGAPVWYPQIEIDAALEAFPDLAKITVPKILVILGGTSKRHRFSVARAKAIVSDLKRIAATGAQIWITSSRRTPVEIGSVFRDFAHEYKALFYGGGSGEGRNPYLAWLASATCALVTEDSTNMITDAAFFGLPIHLLRLEGGDRKFEALHQAFMDAGAARWFTGHLQSWTYTPIRDAARVAQAIANHLTNAAV
jgi:uncharacterized protein